MRIHDHRQRERRGRVLAHGKNHLSTSGSGEFHQPIDLPPPVGALDEGLVAAHAAAVAADEDEGGHTP